MTELFSLKFDPRDIGKLAGRYDYSNEPIMINEIGPRMKANGYLTKADFVRLCHWKSPRTKPRVATNDEDFIRAVTTTAFSTPNEHLRIEVLTLLNGVSWPTASVILHFGHTDPYPILDVRALWSLGVTYPANAYDFEFWWAYVQACRRLAKEHQISMRTLDRALWQYSKEKQPSLKGE